MKIKRRIINIGAAIIVFGAGFAFLPPIYADTLTFTNASASSAAAAMNQRYGVTIVFRGRVNTSLPVTFSVDNPDTPDGRLQAVSTLASALNLDFQKVYVVSKVDPGAAVPAVPVDSNGPIVFSSTRVSVRDAIQTVVAVDNAWVQISPAITGDITLPDTRMTASEAAAAIAKQSGTEWKTYYGLFPRGQSAQLLSGSDSTPIMQLPLLTFRNTISVSAPLHSGDNAPVGPLAPYSSDPTVASVPNTNFGSTPDYYDNGLGYGDPYGYTNPYAPYGYATANGGVAYPGAVYTPGTGVAPAVPGVNAPGVNAAAGTTGTTILPSFPYMGNVGATTAVGGY